MPRLVGILACSVVCAPQAAVAGKPPPPAASHGRALPSPPAATISTTVTAVYEGRLLVKLLDIRSDYVLGGAAYRAGARARSSGAVSLVRPFSVLSQSSGALANRVPMAITASTIGEKRRTVDFRGKAAAFGGDPLTQLLRVQLNRPTPCLGALLFFDGKQRYRLTFAPLAPGALSAQQAAFGLTDPVSCRVGFQPISGLGGSKSARSAPVGPITARFARSNVADLWILVGMDVGTPLGPGHVDLTALKVSKTS